MQLNPHIAGLGYPPIYSTPPIPQITVPVPTSTINKTSIQTHVILSRDQIGVSFLQHIALNDIAKITSMLTLFPWLLDLRIQHNSFRDIGLLHKAVLDDNIYLLNILLACKSNTEVITSDCHLTPLHIAAHLGRVECVNALLAAGANPNAIDDQGFIPFIRAYRRFTILSNALENAGGPFSRLWFFQKFIILRFGLNKRLQVENRSVSLGGYFDTVMPQIFQQALQRYFATQMKNICINPLIWSENDWRDVYLMFRDIDQVSRNLCNGQFTWVRGKIHAQLMGWSNHSTCVVYNDIFLLSCNRGVNSGLFPGITLHLLSNLQKAKNFLEEAATHSCDEKMFTVKLHQDIPPLLTFLLKSQGSENCPWVMVKLMTRSAITLKLHSKGYPILYAFTLSHYIYKHLTLEDRVDSLYQYSYAVNTSKSQLHPYHQNLIIDQELYQDIFHKSQRDKYARVLEALLIVNASLNPTTQILIQAFADKQFAVLNVYRRLRPELFFQHFPKTYNIEPFTLEEKTQGFVYRNNSSQPFYLPYVSRR
jgi:hypothetical protein